MDFYRRHIARFGSERRKLSTVLTSRAHATPQGDGEVKEKHSTVAAVQATGSGSRVRGKAGCWVVELLFTTCLV